MTPAAVTWRPGLIDSSFKKKHFYLDGCPCVGCEDCWECEHAPFQCKDPDQNKDFQKVIGNYIIQFNLIVLYKIFFDFYNAIQCLSIINDDLNECVETCSGSACLECDVKHKEDFLKCPCQAKCPSKQKIGQHLKFFIIFFMNFVIFNH